MLLFASFVRPRRRRRLGSYFGEVAVLIDCRRTASARAIFNSDLLVLDKKDLAEILSAYPNVAMQIYDMAAKSDYNLTAEERQNLMEKAKLARIGATLIKVLGTKRSRETAIAAHGRGHSTRKTGNSAMSSAKRGTIGPSMASMMAEATVRRSVKS